MTDRELLELAAKAAGYNLGIDWNCSPSGIFINGDDIFSGHEWNPLADDGDALRLAVKLQISIANEHVTAGCSYCTKGFVSFDAIYSGGDEDCVIDSDFAATRMAIVIAAASIGREMP